MFILEIAHFHHLHPSRNDEEWPQHHSWYRLRDYLYCSCMGGGVESIADRGHQELAHSWPRGRLPGTKRDLL